MSDSFQAAFDSVRKAEGITEEKLPPDAVKKWFKNAGLVGDETGLTDIEIEKAIVVHAKDMNGITVSELKQCASTLATEKKKEANEFIEKLSQAAEEKKK
ncbi:hypothetical protein TNIN_461271 [Trichonephila inaurata madagascariensis]|uniref:Uncharacterized protein n=1 Tax=Trichonephila inaurata madagascariensis TaxID=2747483 RepID=A0A8X6YBE5_9ARAC|nr:hypothetical protein TNIN_461271 [Trichonephila inaurata madagascariensis]